jgi:tetratricopeptide (TPR) repeat protein
MAKSIRPRQFWPYPVSKRSGILPFGTTADAARHRGEDIMLADDYGNPLTTTSTAARDAYAAGYRLLFMTWPGANAEFARATEADPGFALAYLGSAQVAAMRGDGPAAQAALAAAKTAAVRLSDREASHLGVFETMFSGRLAAAVAAARAHLDAWPRDAAVFNIYGPIIGLISMQGAPGSKRRQAEIMDTFVPHYGDDWWFAAHHAMALAEIGRFDEARPLAEHALRSEPRNPWAVHARAHLAYEAGEPEGGRAVLTAFLDAAPRECAFWSHLAWHLAIAELHAGNHEAARARFEADVAPEVHSGVPRGKVYDAVQFLWRWELAGHPRDPERWRTLDAFARDLLPRAAISFPDIHVALANALAGNHQGLAERLAQMDELEQAGRYPMGGVPQVIARGLASYASGDRAGAIAVLAPLLPELERIGQASRAQLDLIEFTVLRACAELERHDELCTLLARRRKGPGPVPVAGIH